MLSGRRARVWDAWRLRDQGMGHDAIARQLRVGIGTVRQYLREPRPFEIPRPWLGRPVREPPVEPVAIAPPRSEHVEGGPPLTPIVPDIAPRAVRDVPVPSLEGLLALDVPGRVWLLLGAGAIVLVGAWILWPRPQPPPRRPNGHGGYRPGQAPHFPGQ